MGKLRGSGSSRGAAPPCPAAGPVGPEPQGGDPEPPDQPPERLVQSGGSPRGTTEQGQPVHLSEACVTDLQRRMLASEVKTKRDWFIIPKSLPLPLLDLRLIFTELRKVQGLVGSDEERLSAKAFERAFKRLVCLMQDPKPFDAEVFDVNCDGTVAWAEFVLVNRQRKLRSVLSISERIYLTFDQPESSYLAFIISIVVLLTICVSSLSFFLSTIPQCRVTPETCEDLTIVEKGCLLIFVVEFTARLCTCWAVRKEVHDRTKLRELVTGIDPLVLPSPARRFLKFWMAPANIIDACAILPGVIGLFTQEKGGAFVVLRLVRLTRIFRVFRSPALVAPVVVIGRTLEKSTKALYVLAFNLCLGIVISSSLMYMAEGGDELSSFGIGGRWNDTLNVYERRVGSQWNGAEWEDVWAESPFQSILSASWWAIVTATTVGYGDHWPTTMMGCTVGALTMIFSMVILALPVGVMGGTFSQEWERYLREKTLRETAEDDELATIIEAMAEVDPEKLGRILLLEFWHDHPCLPIKPNSRPPSSTFLGEAKVELDLPSDREVSKEMRISLSDSPAVVKRAVTGSVRVRYDWRPSSPCSMAEDAGDELASRIEGTLKVTLISAKNLINMHAVGGSTNPFVTMACFPRYANKNGPQQHFCRMPTITNSLNPQFNMTHVVEFDWKVAADGSPESLERANRATQRVSMCKLRRESVRIGDALPPVRAKVAAGSQGDAGRLGEEVDSALSKMRRLQSVLARQRAETRDMRSEVSKARVSTFTGGGAGGGPSVSVDVVGGAPLNEAFADLPGLLRD